MTVPDAVLALIRAAVPTLTVYDSMIPDQNQPQPPPERYAIFWPDDGSRDIGEDQKRVAVQTTGELYTWQVSSIAPDRGMAAWIAKKIRDAITDVSPAIEGYSCGYIEHLFSVTNREEQVLAVRSVMIPDRYQLLADRIGS